MKLRYGRAWIVAILFLAAQAVPGLHAALEGGHDIHRCCEDGEAAAHFDACRADHDHPPCPVCAAVRAPATLAVDAGPASGECRSLSVDSPPLEIPVDPFHVELPGSRGPPA